jgi:hypothetical protein
MSFGHPQTKNADIDDRQACSDAVKKAGEEQKCGAILQAS